MVILAHSCGEVNLQVACEGFVVSNTVKFTYRYSKHDISQVKSQILQKLEEMEPKLELDTALVS